MMHVDHVDIYLCQCTLEAVHFSQLQELTKLHVWCLARSSLRRALISWILDTSLTSHWVVDMIWYDMIWCIFNLLMCTRFRTERIRTFLGRNLKGLLNLSFLAHAILQTWDGKTLWPSHCCSLKSRWNLQPPPPVWRCPQRRQFTPCPRLPNHLFSCHI